MNISNTQHVRRIMNGYFKYTTCTTHHEWIFQIHNMYDASWMNISNTQHVRRIMNEYFKYTTCTTHHEWYFKYTTCTTHHEWIFQIHNMYDASWMNISNTQYVRRNY